MRTFYGRRHDDGSASASIQNANGSGGVLMARPHLWHWPVSFDWGAVTDESKSLALALLHEATGADNVSLYFAEMFTKGVVAMLPYSWWQLTETAILKWIAQAVESEVFGTSTLFDKSTQEAIANG